MRQTDIPGISFIVQATFPNQGLGVLESIPALMVQKRDTLEGLSVHHWAHTQSNLGEFRYAYLWTERSLHLPVETHLSCI